MATRGRKALDIDLAQLFEDQKKFKPAVLAAKYGVSEPSIRKYTKQAVEEYGPKSAAGYLSASQLVDVHRIQSFGHPVVPEPVVAATQLAGDSLFDEFYWKYRDFIGWKKDVDAPKWTGPSNASELTVVAGDTHAPYQHERAIQRMLYRTAGRARRLILAGDLADMFNMSKYAKFSRHHTPIQEMMRVQALLNLLAEAYPEVVLMRGNHDDRFIKYIQRMGLPAEMFEVFDYLHGQYSLHPIYVLARHLSNVKIVEPINHDYASFSYLYQQGDAIISHAEKYSRIPNKTVGDVIQALKSYHEPQGVVKPFKVVIQAHTHQAGKTFNDFGVVGIENGCLCVTPDYSGDAKRLPVRGSVLGYTELWQQHGVSDLVNTNFVPYTE